MRKRKEPSKIKEHSKELASLDASVKKLKSLLVDPNFSVWSQNGAFSVTRQRLLSIGYRTIRRVVDQVPIINAIINTRSDQMLPFCKRAVEKSDDKGFEIIPVRGYKGRDSEMDQLYTFFEQTGFQYDPDREDDLMDYVQMFIRETLTIDQVATEIQKNRFGEPTAFWLLDGATIERAANNSSFSKNVKFVQKVNMKAVNTYTNDDLIFDYKNKRADIRYRGYGYSPVEMAIDIITTLLFGYRYLRDQLIRDKVPKGFIAVLGDADSDQLDSIRRYWYAAMNGAGGRWNIPILPSGKDGIGIDWKSIQPSNKDMEYHKGMMFISSVCASVFSSDLAELGLKADDSQAIIGESGKPRLEASKDRGLGSLLSFTEQNLNKVLRKITTNYAFRFVGFEPQDQLSRANLDKIRISSYSTINEIREELGLKKIDEDYADVVLNMQAVQLYQASKNQEQMQQQQPESGSEEQQPVGAENEGQSAGTENEGETNWNDLFSKSMSEDDEISIKVK